MRSKAKADVVCFLTHVRSHGPQLMQDRGGADCKMAVRQRGVGGGKRAEQREYGKQWQARKAPINEKRSNIIAIGLIIYLFLLFLAAFTSHYSLPAPNLSTTGNQFSALNARRHLKAITSLGVRHAGSIVNDIHTKDLLLSIINKIKASASPSVTIETSVQHPSGHFYLEFLGGLTHIYENLTNVVVRLKGAGQSSDHALLVNCHFDSALGSPAASDDAVSCAVLLETLRVLSSGPSPFPLKHSVIFLFNGAEEMLLPAAHGFITQHEWAGQVRAFLNLEAAGAGGKEILFQTGPKHPWLAAAYSRSVPFPHASVVAQEIFQAGVIPSDTDFRIFRDHGGIPGIDMAFFVNGYVYHTQYDTDDRIPDGSIQRAGENILALIKEIGSSDLLADPGEDRHGKVAYYDVLGLVMVYYPERLGLIMNYGVLGLGLVGLWLSGRRRRGEVTASYRLIFLSIPVILVSLLFGTLLSLITGLITTLTGNTLSFFARPYMVIPLYYTPTVLGIGAVQYWWRRKFSSINGEQFDRILLQSNQLILWFSLLILTLLRLASSCLPFVLLLFSLSFRTLIWDNMLRPQLRPSSLVTMGYLIFTVLSLLPVVLLAVFAVGVTELFIPLMGRVGAIVSSDVIMAIVSSILTCLAFMSFVPIIIHYSTRQFLHYLFLLASLLWLLALLIVSAGLVFPYSSQEPVRPKRFYLQHSQVNNHNNPQESFSGVYVHTFDYREMNPLLEYVPKLREAKEVPCEGLYCGIPSYLPIAHMLKRNWFLPGSPPPAAAGSSSKLILDNVKKTSPNTRNYTFTAHLPPNARIHLQPLSGLRLHSWSLEEYIPPVTPYGKGLGCYYIMYTRGTGEGNTTFWIEVEGNTDIFPSLQISLISIYINPPLSHSTELQKLLNTLPSFVSTISWTSVMDNMIF